MRLIKTWRKRETKEVLAEQLVEELGLSNLCAHIVAARGLSDVSAAKDFLEPSLKKLLEPSLFADMDKASARICEAIFKGERIGIFGDYDVDGVCSTAVLEEFLIACGAHVSSTLPHRMSEGYGLSRPGIDRLKGCGASLLITVDCGITAHDAIGYAHSQGFQVIVVDHHTVGETLPNALAVINPKRADCSSRASYLCAAGIAFFLCIAVRRQLRACNYFVDRPEPDVRHSLDLVALATVCDVVPLIKDNRAIVRAGLRVIKLGLRPGLTALIEAARVDAQKISSTNLGFHLGPRINAAGRLDDANFALKLLHMKDASTACMMARELDDTNQERRAIEEATVQKASMIIETDARYKDAPALVLHDEAWHPGVVGIVASRIAERFHRPTIIIGEKGKGSGRSIKGVDLHSMVSKASASLLGFGGHAHAIGVTLGPEGVAKFRDELVAVMAIEIPTHVFTPELVYDAEVAINKVSLAVIDELARLEPFGAHNPYPVVRINNCFVRNWRRLEGGHIKGELEGVSGALSFIGFRMDLSDEHASAPLDVLGVLEKNQWQDRISLQLRLIDYRKSPSSEGLYGFMSP